MDLQIEPACLVASRSEEELRKPRREGGKVAAVERLSLEEDSELRAERARGGGKVGG
jgi:hypothetical protein